MIVASIVTGTLLCSVVLLSALRNKRPRNAKPNEDATTKTMAHTIMMTTGPESAADVPFDLGRTRAVGTGIGIVVGTEIDAGVGVAVDATVGDSVVGDCVGCVVGLNVDEGVGMVVSRDEGAGVGEKVVKVGEGVGAGVGEKVVTLKLSTDASDIERRRRSPPPSSPVVRRRWPSRSSKFTISAVSVPSTTDVFSTSVTCSCTETPKAAAITSGTVTSFETETELDVTSVQTGSENVALVMIESSALSKTVALKSLQLIPKIVIDTATMGVRLGLGVGMGVGNAVVGTAVGTAVGMAVGTAIGTAVGTAIGKAVGMIVGAAVGMEEGVGTGNADGFSGTRVRTDVGKADTGVSVGTGVGVGQSQPPQSQ